MKQDHHDSHGKPGDGSLVEHRFEAEPTSLANLQALVGGLGATALGAGAYATWMHEVPMPAGSPLIVGGVIGIIAATLMGSSDSNPIRVGDAGVAVERGDGQPERIAWYEVDSIALDGGRVVVEAGKKRIVAPVVHHAGAAGWILKEGLDRIPKRVKVPADQQHAILRGADEHGKALRIEALQMAGRRCKASNTVISFEKDARACTRCGEVYEKKHVHEKCLTCDAPMQAEGRAAAHA